MTNGMPEIPSNSLILMAYRGSIAHGMYIPDTDPNSIDDIDLMGINVPGRSYYHGLEGFGHSDTVEIKHGHWDIVCYEAKKAIRLLAAGNPNVLSLLWVDDEHVLQTSTPGFLLRASRNLFMTQRIIPAFIGYAQGQLHKMEHNVFEGYMGAKRKALVEQFGYDTKNASHCIRLLRMGTEAILSGRMLVNRTGIDADELLAIKRGEYKLEAIKALAESHLDNLRMAEKITDLPPLPDMARIGELTMEIVEQGMALHG